MAFVTLSLTQLFHSYNVKSDGSVFRKETFDNKFLNLAFVVGVAMQMLVVYVPGLNGVFQSVALSISQLGIAVGFAFGIVVIMEIYKLVVRLVKRIK